jgi:uncharacterized SAM-binding protein YcdF (DUF218 family)
LLLPPGGLILLALVGMLFWRRVWGRGLVFFSLALMWLLATEPVRDLLSSPLENHYPPLSLQNAPHDDAAIVLMGGGIYASAPEYNGSDELAGSGLMRALYAADLALKTGLPVYASGGSPLAEGHQAEGAVMRRWLLRLGVPPEQAFAETSANNSWQNAVYMKRVLAERGIRRVILVTSAWHMPRSVWSFRVQGLEVIPAPCDYLTKQDSYDLRSFLPSWRALSDCGQVLHEYLGMLWYRLRYD